MGMIVQGQFWVVIAIFSWAFFFFSCEEPDGLPEVPEQKISDPSGDFEATIHRSSSGVAHIMAENLESAAFGQGYAQAEDNICLIADMVTKVRGERSKYYGPGAGDSNIITDFSIKALGLHTNASEQFSTLSPSARAMFTGFAAGYNKYLDETGSKGITDPRCSGGDWVKPIEPEDIFAYLKTIALMTSSDWIAENGLMFIAVPPETDPGPQPIGSSNTNSAELNRLLAGDLPEWISGEKELALQPAEMGIGSNAWGLGRDMTANGRGALLANPHFPYFGSHRFWQSQITIPGLINVNGAALIGTPIPQVGFNENLAWSHTVSSSSQLTFYRLNLKDDDPLVYIKDGEEKNIREETVQIEVKAGGNENIMMEKSFFFSEYGPMIAADRMGGDLPSWGEENNGSRVAFTFREAVSEQVRYSIDHWLGFGRASNLNQFQSVLEGCGNTLFVNTIYADRHGNAAYFDGSAVPHLPDEALADLEDRPSISGIPVLDGSTSAHDWLDGDCGTGSVPFSEAPRLVRSDFVQNSNDTYWATNPRELLTGYSLLYGSVEQPLSIRTRMGLHMLLNPEDPGMADDSPAGEDGLFDAEDLINVIHNNRNFHAELSGVLEALLHRCERIGDGEVHLEELSRTVADGCNAIAGWDGLLNTDSRGAHTFRLFMGEFNRHLPGYYTNEFDASMPAETPSTPAQADGNLADDPMLQALGAALGKLDRVQIAYDERLGEVQRVHLSEGSAPGGTPEPAAEPIPWHGGKGDLEGAFNLAVVRAAGPNVHEAGTRYPMLAPEQPVARTNGMSDQPGMGWMISGGTSWHFGVHFTDEGPEAYGLLSYSQSSNPNSPFFMNQHLKYSNKEYRKLRYTEEEILADPGVRTVTIKGSN